MDPTKIDKRSHSFLAFPPPNSSILQSRHGMSAEMTQPSTSSCCCGRLQCAYLQHNAAALDSLEKHLRSAAQLGQNLLIRHEAYVASAEEERRQMAANIERLEEEKKGLEVANAEIIEENRNLLDDLEGINNSLSSSDAQIQSLTSALDLTRDEIERLQVLAARSSRLEAQLLQMETEQSRLQNQLGSTELDCRSATQRWKSAERTIATLHEYVDRIEDEARKEREQHEEVLLQLEQRRSVERELQTAAGRLKGAAAVTRLGRGQGNNDTVSRFVTDILRDNAKLQMGIVELRKLLSNSNDEVETLRDQILVHQPILPPEEHGVPQTRLRSELAMSSATESRSEYHIYHHYQSAGRLVREKSRKVHRPRKARNFTVSELPTLRSGVRTPRTPGIRVKKDDGGATLGSRAVSSQFSSTHRWSMESSQAQQSIAPSTVPSSPHSVHRNPSIFDTLDSTVDFSRPTSPESLTVESPRFLSHHRAPSDASFTSLSRPSYFEPKHSTPNRLLSLPADQKTPENSDVSLDSPAAPRETNVDSPTIVADINPGSSSGDGEIFDPSLPFRPRLHRSTSHESILPISSSSFRQPPSHLFNPVMLPSCAVLTHTPATALPASHALHLSSSSYNRSLLSNLRGSSSGGPTNGPSANHPHSSTGKQPTKQPQQTLGKRVGGWVLGKWGLVPMASTGDLRAQAKLSDTTLRATGVNQKGPIRGLGSIEKKKARAEVQVGIIDESLLQESLAEG